MFVVVFECSFVGFLGRLAQALASGLALALMGRVAQVATMYVLEMKAALGVACFTVPTPRESTGEGRGAKWK